MTEWGVVSVIIGLVGLIGVFVKVGVTSSRSSQRLADSNESLKTSIDDLKIEMRTFNDDNKADHKEFRSQIGDHETRISVLEHK